MRMRVGGSTLIAIALAAQFQALRAEWTTTNQGKTAQTCRIGATTSKTRMEAQKGFWAESMSTCRFDKATSKSTCTNEYVDSVGTKATTVSVTTFASVADVIDEVKVISAVAALDHDRNQGFGTETGLDDGRRQLVRRRAAVGEGRRHRHDGAAVFDYL